MPEDYSEQSQEQGEATAKLPPVEHAADLDNTEVIESSLEGPGAPPQRASDAPPPATYTPLHDSTAHDQDNNDILEYTADGVSVSHEPPESTGPLPSDPETLLSATEAEPGPEIPTGESGRASLPATNGVYHPAPHFDDEPDTKLLPLRISSEPTMPLARPEGFFLPAYSPRATRLNEVERRKLRRVTRLQYFSRKHLRRTRSKERRDARHLWTT